MSAVALPPSPGVSPSLTAIPGRRERVLVPWRLGALVLTGLLGAATFPIAFPVGQGLLAGYPYRQFSSVITGQVGTANFRLESGRYWRPNLMFPGLGGKLR